jgi:hypothetical protein
METEDGGTDLILGVPMEIWGLNPDTGKLRWFCSAMETDSFCSSVVPGDGIVYAMEGRDGGSVAVRVGGQDDVTESHIEWNGDDANRIGTPVLHDGRIYSFAGGMVSCVDAATGKRIFRERLRNGTDRSSSRGFGGDYASPVIADGKLYFVTRGGDMFVLRAGAEFEQLAVNHVTAGSEDFSATPAISDGDIFIRSDKRLYCIAEGTSTPADPNETGETAVADPGGPPGGGFGRRGPGGRGPGRGFDLEQIFKQRDADDDGKLTGDEISERLKENLAIVDTDKDSTVTLEEFRVGVQKIFARGGGRRGAGRGGYGRNLRQGRPERPQRPEMEDAPKTAQDT